MFNIKKKLYNLEWLAINKSSFCYSTFLHRIWTSIFPIVNIDCNTVTGYTSLVIIMRLNAEDTCAKRIVTYPGQDRASHLDTWNEMLLLQRCAYNGHGRFRFLSECSPNRSPFYKVRKHLKNKLSAAECDFFLYCVSYPISNMHKRDITVEKLFSVLSLSFA